MLLFQILPEFQEKLQSAVNKLLSKLESSQQKSDYHDYSVYTGTTGIATLYLLLGQRLNNPSYTKVSDNQAYTCLFDAIKVTILPVMQTV